MNETESLAENGTSGKSSLGRPWWVLSISSAVLPWLGQPPLAWWPLALVAVIPLLYASTMVAMNRKQYALLYLAAVIYWALTLQGLRHANPLIYPCWIALSAYLAIYPILFVIVLRRSLRLGIPMSVAAPLAWVGMECIRNYLLTGISAAMLGHTMAEVPLMIQIADLGGTYAVSLVLVSFNVALLSLATWQWPGRRDVAAPRRFPAGAIAVAIVLMAATLLYGRFRLGQSTAPGPTTFALIGRSEPVEYDQDSSRELELFGAYAEESIEAFESTPEAIDAVVWPESMFTGTLPWLMGEGNERLAQEMGLSENEIKATIAERRRAFQFRAASLQGMLAQRNGPGSVAPDIVAGCGVVDYGQTPRAYSGIVHVGPEGALQAWYGKMHLVMFGEYIPLVRHVPLVRDWVPKNLGLTAGETAKRFEVGRSSVCPNICIETAVERVPIKQVRQLRQGPGGSLPDLIVTVTNDMWFDDSSVVRHHLRCAQLVAVACRRPILSAANNGPTVWIDSNGRVVRGLPQGGRGSVIARPELDDRTSLVVRIGDWPARICAMLFLGLLLRKPTA
jgi:apolipoprotein N-acyltransferase